MSAPERCGVEAANIFIAPILGNLDAYDASRRAGVTGA